MLKFLFAFSYFLLIPIFFFEREYVWSKISLFSVLNLLWFVLFMGKGRRMRFTRYLLIVLAYIIASLLSFLYAYDIYRSLYLFIIYLNALCFLFILHMIDPPEDEVAYVVLISVFAVSIVGFLQYFGFLRASYTKYGERDISSTFGLSNFAGEFLAVLSLFLYIFFSDKKRAWAGISGIIIAFLYIVLARARAAFLGLTGGALLGFLIFIVKRRIRILWLLLPPIIIVGIMLTPYGMGMLKGLKSGFALKDSPSVYRIECWKASLKIFEDHPFTGVGLGNFEVYARKYGSEELERLADSATVKVKRPHNEYLQVLSETGIIGFLTFVTLLFYPLYFALKGRKPHLIAPQISFMLIAIFSFPMQNISALSSYIFASYLSTYSERIDKKVPKLFYPLIGLLILFTIILSSIIFLGEVNRRKAIVAYNRGMYSQSLFYINRAIRFNPWESDHYFSRGQTYYKLRNYAKAIEDFKKYLRKNPYHGRAHLIISILEYDMGKFEEAKEHIELAFKYSKRKIPLLYLSAFLIYREGGEEKKAMEVLNEGLSIYPDLLNMLNNKKWFGIPDNP